MKKFLPVLLLSCLVSCTPSPEAAEDTLVVEGWIESGLPPVVMLTTSFSPSEEPTTLSSLEDHVIKWAKVTVSDGVSEVVLMGKSDRNYYPPYIYTSSYILGEPGKTYTLKVDYKDYHAEAVTTVPLPSALDSIAVKQPSDTIYTLSAFLTPRPGEYYRFFLRIEGRDEAYVPSMNGTFSGSGMGSSQVEVPLVVNRSLSSWDYREGFRKGEKVHIRLSTMDRSSWEFWSDFEEVSAMAASPVFPVRYNIRSNVVGAEGYWAGYGSTYYTVSIE